MWQTVQFFGLGVPTPNAAMSASEAAMFPSNFGDVIFVVRLVFVYCRLQLAS